MHTRHHTCGSAYGAGGETKQLQNRLPAKMTTGAVTLDKSYTGGSLLPYSAALHVSRKGLGWKPCLAAAAATMSPAAAAVTVLADHMLQGLPVLSGALQHADAGWHIQLIQAAGRAQSTTINMLHMPCWQANTMPCPVPAASGTKAGVNSG
jgi:hypothetical protein